MTDELRKDWSLHSSEWAYNQTGWKPCCYRCNKRRQDCRKYNSEELGSFAGDWICTDCVLSTDTLTPCEKVMAKYGKQGAN